MDKNNSINVNLSFEWYMMMTGIIFSFVGLSSSIIKCAAAQSAANKAQKAIK